MENTDPQYARFAHGVHNCFIHNQIELGPQSMETTPEALEYEFVTKHLDKPLQNEIEVLRYYKIIGERNNTNIQSLFNATDEVEKIKSGYYINIDESLNIFKQYHDLELNPFLKFHEDSTEYIKFAQKQWWSTRNEPENILFCPETFIESDIQGAGLEIDENESLSLFNVSNSGIDYNSAQNAPKKVQKESKIAQNESKTAHKKSTIAEKGSKSSQEQKKKVKIGGKTAKKKLNFTGETKTVAKQNKISATKQSIVYHQDENIVNNRRTRSGKVYFSAENPPKIFKKNIVPEKNTKKVLKMSNNLEIAPTLHFKNLPLSPLFPYFSSKEIQLFILKNREEERKYLQFLEAQFHESIIEENGTILYPILTNSNFEGFTYDLSQELRNNQVIKTELFCRFWRN